LVSTLGVLPSIVSTLYGGVLGDRHGPGRLLVRCTIAHAALLLILALAATKISGVVLLATAAGAVSILGSLRQPAAVVLPRLLISDERQFERALAHISGSTHAARIIGVGAGGVA